MSHKGKINRREFMKGVGGTVAAGIGMPFVLASSSRGENGAISPSERITLGCIGTGRRARAI